MNKVKVNIEDWEFAQKGELDFHRTNKWRKDNQKFLDSNYNLFKNKFEFDENEYSGKNVLDVGCGSKLRAKFFKNSFIYALEPLANKFMEEIDWCDLSDAHKVYSVPAEQLIPEIIGDMDLVFSINVIDHCYNFIDIVNNLYQYTKNDGLCLLSFDLHDKIDSMHPIILTDEFATNTFLETGFLISKKIETSPYHKGISNLAMTYYLNK